MNSKCKYTTFFVNSKKSRNFASPIERTNHPLAIENQRRGAGVVDRGGLENR